jgi:hypothetical protein
MKQLALLAALAYSQSAFSADALTAAFERLRYESAKNVSLETRLDSAADYFESLDRNGLEPLSKENCLLSIRSGSPGSSCLGINSQVHSGGGTGGVD